MGNVEPFNNIQNAIRHVVEYADALTVSEVIKDDAQPLVVTVGNYQLYVLFIVLVRSDYYFLKALLFKHWMGHFKWCRRDKCLVFEHKEVVDRLSDRRSVI